MPRRRYLLSVLNTETYRNYYYEYLYHNVVPSELIGFNLWDEELEVGSIDSSTGQNINSSTISRSKNYTRVVPSTNVYVHIGSANIYQGCYVYFYDINKNYIGVKYSANYSTYSRIIAIPSNCCYIRFRLDDFYGTTYNHDICINISNSKFNGVYLPYDPKEVRNQGKTKLVKIEGNGEIENQLFDYTQLPTATHNGITYTNNDDGSYTISGTASGGNSYFLFYNVANANNHTYLVKGCAYGGSNSSYMIRIADGVGNDIGYDYGSGVIIKNTNGIACYMRVINGYDMGTGKVFKPNFIDLAQEFPFDTPTSLTDYRVQNIIAKGTRPYNTGSYNSTTIQDVETKGFNLFNEIWVDGYINSSTGNINTSTGYKTTDFIKVIPNETYYCKATLISFDTPNVGYYDKDKNFIEFKGSLGHFFNNTFSFPNGVEYIRVTITNQYVTTDEFCINRSSNLNGTYKPFNNFIDLANFNKLDINGIHNEFKALDSGYVLRKKLGVVDLAKLTWTQGTSSVGLTYYETQLPSNAKTGVLGIIPNIATEKYVLAEGNQYSNAQYGTFAYSSLYITIYTQTSPTGICYYELATYETVNIPLNHLGMVKLKDLNWGIMEYPSGSGKKIFYANNQTQATNTTNVYCSKYITVADIYNTTDKTITCNGGGGVSVWVRDYSYNDATSFKNHFTDDDVLYYETVDVIDETGIVLEHNKISLPQPLKLDGVGSIHNTFEITKDNYVFTRNVFGIDLGTADWNKDSNNKVSFNLSNLKNVANDVTVNALCDSYIAKPYNSLYSSSSNLEFGCANNTQALSFYKQNGYANVSTRAEIQALFSGNSLTYQLATPQIINIPRKHLGAVRLKDLSWTYLGDSYKTFSSSVVEGCITPAVGSNKKPFTNCYISSNPSYVSGLVNNNIMYRIDGKGVYIHDNTYNNATDFANHFTDDDILFFETENEVEDFVNEAIFQKGGEVNGLQNNIPQEYQEVEYIESTGTQYIDSGLKGNQDSAVEIKAKATGTMVAGYRLFGSRNMTQSDGLFISTNSNNGDVYADYGNQNAISSSLVIDSNVHTHKLSKNGYYFDNQLVNTFVYETFATPNNLIIFGGYSGGSIVSKSWKIYYFKLYNNSTLVRDFIPCYRKSDNVIGLYDKVEGKFYTNQGTGTFLMGASVDNSYTCEVLPNVEMKFQCK